MAGKSISTGSTETAVAAELTETAAVETPSSARRMGVVRFLQIEPQKSGIAAILRRRYALEVHTLAEWKSLVAYVLNRKVK